MIAPSTNPRFGSRFRGFTLVEILVSLAVLAVLLLVSANVISQVQRTWSASAARVAQFREARIAFDIITKSLSQATLNAYLDYSNNYLENPSAVRGGNVTYQRDSELRFVSGPASSLVPGGGGEGGALPGHAVFFQAPMGIVRNAAYSGLDSLLCGRGYFVQLSDDDAFRPPFVTQQRVRYRLMEFSPPAEENLIYADTTAAPRTPGRWFATAGAELQAGETEATRGVTRPIADNIVLMLISPRTEPAVGGTAVDPLAISPDYWYDSITAATGTNQGNQHQLPPLVRVVLVAIDEPSSQRLEARNGGAGNMPNLLGDSGASFTNARNMEADLEQFTNYLVEQSVNFRVFSATVPILGSKWSS